MKVSGRRFQPVSATGGVIMVVILEEVALMGHSRWHPLPPELRRQVMRLALQGLSYNQIPPGVSGSDVVAAAKIAPVGA